MYCSQCGENLPDQSGFCSSCGYEIQNNSSSTDTVSETEKPAAAASIDAPTKEEIASALRVRPWVRYWARVLDVFLYSIPAGFIIGVLFPNSFNEPGGEYILSIVLLLSWAFVEAGVLSAFGTTPGKALFKVRLTCTSSAGFTYSGALKRSIKVWWRGFGTGLPIVSLVTLVVAYHKLSRDRRTSWDADGGYMVRHERIGPARVLFAIVFFIVYFMLIVAGETMNA